MNLENLILSEVSQEQGIQYYTVALTQGPWDRQIHRNRVESRILVAVGRAVGLEGERMINYYLMGTELLFALMKKF